MAFKCERKFAKLAVGAQNSGVNTDWNQLQEMAQEEIEATLAELPEPLRNQAKTLPVTLEQVPNAGLQADGVNSETLGIFTGAEFVDDGATVLPPQIILFIGNLWEFSGKDEVVYCEEVRTTFLHELGHFFGLDENDLIIRGLE